MVRTRWYPQGLGAFMGGLIDFDTHTIKMAVMDATFAFNDSHDFWDDVSASDYSSATGYTAGGNQLTTPAIVETDSSALTARANSTAYVVGDIRRTGTDSSRVFVCAVAGTSAASEPGGMATLGFLREITDGSVVWVNIGAAITVLDSDAESWTGLDQSPTNAAVIYRDTGTPSTSPLIAYVDFEASETPTSLTVTPPVEGWVWVGSGMAL